MLSRLRSGTLVGIDARLVDVEVDMTLGLPYFHVVGLPDGAAKESKVRVVSALKNSGFELPQKRVTVNLAPAELRKDGSTFELPVALGVLVAAGQILEDPLVDYLFGGELALDGWVKPIRGVLPMAITARNHGFRKIMVPAANAAEAALVDRVQVFPVNHLREAVDHLTGIAPILPLMPGDGVKPPPPSQNAPDMRDVRGQNEIKDALEIAAAGAHNLLMCGPAGSGKTMLAQRLPSILPPMQFLEALEVTKIYSVQGLLGEGQGLVSTRPFRSPHHTISDAGLVGGGPLTRPGELSLAHNGVLFLDELPEFRKNVLETLRQPLEEGLIRLARATQNIVYPCNVMMVAAMNPCPCGFYNVPDRACTCPGFRVRDYFSRISGPLLDRIDITLQTRSVELEKLRPAESGELPSSHYRDRVEIARDRQLRRFRGLPGVFANSQMGPAMLGRFCKMNPVANDALEIAVKKHGLSARAHHRIIKVARTRADLEGHEQIEPDDMFVAIDCRMLDRKGWLAAAAATDVKGKDGAPYWKTISRPEREKALGDVPPEVAPS
ncbi:MAG: YifB family Mg chelatase-like AAA ATPase [Myxococcaceae bacterium]